MYGMDISNYQRGIDLSKGNYDFCIIKATEGIGYIDQNFYSAGRKLMQLNKLIGCYHYARPDLHGTTTTMEGEADWFVEKVREAGLLNNSILVLDWETEPMDRPDLIEAWTAEVERLTGIIPFIYGSRSKLNKWKGYEVIKTHPIWVAVWPNTKKYDVGTDPKLSLPKTDFPWQIWQYSSTGTYPGHPGVIDLDYSNMSKEYWMIRAGHIEESKTEELSDDMKWAIEFGLFSGYEDGTYRENKFLTRGQAASLFRRFLYLTD